MLELLAADKAAAAALAESETMLAEMRHSAEEFMLYGVPRAEMTALLLEIFESADADKSGALDRAVRGQGLGSGAGVERRRDHL